MTTRSGSISAVNWLASLEKTVAQFSSETRRNLEKRRRTETGREEHDVEIGDQLLGVCVKHANAGDDVTGKTDTDNLHNGFEDEEDKVAEAGV